MSPPSEKRLGKVLNSSKAADLEESSGSPADETRTADSEESSDSSSGETRTADSEESSYSPSDNSSGAEDGQYSKVREASGAYPKACHSCRRVCRRVKRRELMLKCSQCVLAFCGHCLKVRHGEDLLEEAQPGLQWVCPRCRPGCGPGCIKTCCFCSRCCRSIKGVQPRAAPDAKQFYNKAKSVGSCGHDYSIHEDTGESLEAIAKRKLSSGWTKAGSNYSPSSDVTGTRNDRHPLPHYDPNEKKGDEKNRSQHDIRLLEAVAEEFTHLSDAIQHDLKQTTTHDTKHSETDDEEADLGKCSLADGADGLTANAEFEFDIANEVLTANAELDFDPANEDLSAHAEFDFDAANKTSSANAEVDFDAAHKALRDSFETVGNTAVNVEPLTTWFSREKYSSGNRLSITLTDEEVQNIDEYKVILSSAIEILHQFDPEKMTLPECQDESLKQRVKCHAMKWLAKYRTFLQDLIKDRLNNAVPKAKRDSELAIQQIIAAVEKAVHAIPYNNH